MLASLLPGLRDVRTPLTVGYLWLVMAWITWGQYLPTEKPKEENVVRRLFELNELMGAPATLAAVSFVAYLLGALLTIPLEGRLFSRLFWNVPTLASTGFTRDQYRIHVRGLAQDLQLRASGESYRRLVELGLESLAKRARSRLHKEESGVPRDFGREVSELTREGVADTLEDLRAQLLVTNQQLYGEYDRLAAEASFRINVALPIGALSSSAALDSSSWLYLLVSPVIPYLLLMQGVNRYVMATSVIHKAVLGGVLAHPFTTALESLGGAVPEAHPGAPEQEGDDAPVL